MTKQLCLEWLAEMVTLTLEKLIKDTHKSQYWRRRLQGVGSDQMRLELVIQLAKLLRALNHKSPTAGWEGTELKVAGEHHLTGHGFSVTPPYDRRPPKHLLPTAGFLHEKNCRLLSLVQHLFNLPNVTSRKAIWVYSVISYLHLNRLNKLKLFKLVSALRLRSSTISHMTSSISNYVKFSI